MKDNLGLVHIYTGDGKGKTTAAVGLATRALGQGLRVCYVSFHKRPEKYGYTEMQSLEKLGATILNMAKGHPHMDTSLDVDKIRQETHDALKTVLTLIRAESFDLLIMDEIIISVRDKFIEEQELIDFILNKPENMELIITGRGATNRMIEIAHYVSQINKIKHPYDEGISSRKGIEF